jgi:hypothetical protein
LDYGSVITMSTADRATVYWLVRLGGFAVIVPLTLARSGSGHRLFVISVMAAGGVLLALWGVLDWRDRRAMPWPAWVRVAVLGVLAATGGTAAALSPARSVVWFAAMAGTRESGLRRRPPWLPGPGRHKASSGGPLRWRNAAGSPGRSTTC